MDVNVQIPEPLWSVMQACETFCVAECCGLDAFDISAEPLIQWSHPDKQTLLSQGIEQVETLMKTFSGKNHYCSGQLNYCGACREWSEMLSRWKVAMKDALAFSEGVA